jgi:hypothetical protein
VNLRKLAKGRDCEIRLPGICSGDNSTVVLCHIPGGGLGAKQNDLFGAYGCHSCHSEVDGRTQKIRDRIKVRAWFLDGVIRTQQILLDEGVIRV